MCTSTLPSSVTCCCNFATQKACPQSSVIQNGIYFNKQVHWISFKCDCWIVGDIPLRLPASLPLSAAHKLSMPRALRFQVAKLEHCQDRYFLHTWQTLAEVLSPLLRQENWPAEFDNWFNVHRVKQTCIKNYTVMMGTQTGWRFQWKQASCLRDWKTNGTSFLPGIVDHWMKFPAQWFVSLAI